MPQKTFENLKAKISYLNDKDQNDVKRAFEFALQAHENQKRRTGEAYVFHGLKTAMYLSELKLDSPSLQAALLHDTIEDTTVTLSEIQKTFGKTVAFLIDGVTKLGKIRITRRWFILKSQKEMAAFDRQIETLRKMFVAMAKDIRVVLIKLADRLHNMQTLEGVEPS